MCLFFFLNSQLSTQCPEKNHHTTDFWKNIQVHDMTWLIHTCRESCHTSNATYDVRHNQRGSIQQRLLGRTHVFSKFNFTAIFFGTMSAEKTTHVRGRQRKRARAREQGEQEKIKRARKRSKCVADRESARKRENRGGGEKNRERKKDGSNFKVSFVVFSVFSSPFYSDFRFLRSQVYIDFFRRQFSFSQKSVLQWFSFSQKSFLHEHFLSIQFYIDVFSEATSTVISFRTADCR